MNYSNRISHGKPPQLTHLDLNLLQIRRMSTAIIPLIESQLHGVYRHPHLLQEEPYIPSTVF